MDSGGPTWPEYWKLEELESVKASLAITKWKRTVDATANIRKKVLSLKRDWWKPWDDKRYPCSAIHYSKL
jgi:hypothetical protein